MRRTTSPHPVRARPPRRAVRHLRRPPGIAAVVAAAWVSAAVVLPAGAQDLPPRQNRQAGEPPPARVDPAQSGEAGATRPATEPATEPAANGSPFADLSPADLRVQLGKAFAELAHPDSAVRETARVKLMGLSRSDLPAFEAVVRDSLPLAAAQATALRELAIHIYLSGESYRCSKTEGFLGVQLSDVNVGDRPAEEPAAPPAVGVLEGPRLRLPALPPGPFDPPAPIGQPTTGVAIPKRMPGFCGARMLQDADVVLGITVGSRRIPIRTKYEMQMTVVQFTAGQAVQFEVLRRGQVVHVPIVLDPRPSDPDPVVGFQPLLDARQATAEVYWAQMFGPMLKKRAG